MGKLELKRSICIVDFEAVSFVLTIGSVTFRCWFTSTVTITT